MGRRYKKYLALALSVSLILQGQVMTVSATSSDLLNQDELYAEEAYDAVAEEPFVETDEDHIVDLEVGIDEDFNDASILEAPGAVSTTAANRDFEIRNDGTLVKYTGSDENVIIPDGVRQIGSRAFQDNSVIKSVKIADSVKTIGDYAFWYCSSLKTIDLGNVEQIGESAFSNCSSLEEIELPDGLEVIEQSTFENCSLNRISIPDSVKKIGPGAFYSGLFAEEIILPENLEEIGTYAFYDCTISRIVIPKNTVLEEDVFLKVHIKQLYFENGTTRIPGGIAGTVEHIYIPEEVTSIGYIPWKTMVHGQSGSYAQQYAKEEELPFFNNELSIESDSSVSVIEGGPVEQELNWSSDNEKIATVDQSGVVQGVSGGTCNITAWDADGVNIGCCVVNVICNFVIEDGVLVKYTGKDANVAIPDGITEIGEKAFDDNSYVKSVYLPDSVRIIDNYGFGYCGHLEEINLKNVESIGERAFTHCMALKNIDASNAKKIGPNAFMACMELEKIVLSDELEDIESMAFYVCMNLREINMPNSLKRIEDSAFFGALAAEEIVLPEGLELIGSNAFYNAKIGKLVIPKDTAIDSYGIDANIKQLIFKEGRKEIPSGVFFSSKVNHIYIPEEVTKIGADCRESTIHGKPGSYAQEYAQKTNTPFFSNELMVVIGSSASVIENGSSETQYTWKSDDESIAIVDENGVVYGVSAGTCNIYTIDEDGVEIGLCEVNVSDFVIENNVLIKYLGSKEDITIPDGVTEIGFRAFADNANIKSVNMSDSVKVVGNYAFANCWGLKSIDLGNVEKIGIGAFWCQEEEGSIEEIVLPESLQKIGNYAFAGWNMSKFTIPKISSDARNILLDSNIRQLYIADGTKEISDKLLAAVTAEHIYIPKEVAEIGYIPKSTVIHGMPESSAYQYAKKHDNAFFYNEFSLEVFSSADVMEGGLSNEQYTWKSDDESIATVDENGKVSGVSIGICNITTKDEDGLEIGRCVVNVTALLHAVNSLEDFQSLHNYEDGCREIWEFSAPEADQVMIRFSEDTELEEGADKIYITDEKNTEVGVYTGKELSGKRIYVHSGTVRVILESNDSINAYGFRVVEAEGINSKEFNIYRGYLKEYYGTNEKVVIPDGVDRIDRAAFSFNTTIKSVILPDSVREIELESFYECSELEYINLENVELIGFAAFYRCNNLAAADARNATTIKGYAFFGCTNLAYFDARNAKEIGEYACNWCNNLKEIVLPDELEEIKDYSFSSGSISKFNLPKSLKRIGAGALGGISTDELILPENLEVIGESAFRGSYISKITIPNNIVLEDYSLGGHIRQLFFEKGRNEIPGRAAYSSFIEHIYISEDITVIGSLNGDSIIHGKPGSYAYQYAKKNGNTFFSNELSIDVGSSVSVIEYGFIDPQYTWESDDESIATVDENGIVHGVSEGTCNITAKDTDGLEIGWCAVTVQKTLFSAEGVLQRYVGTDEVVVIPDGVTEIGPDVFKDNTTIRIVRLPESVRTISETAFIGCTNLEHIYIPEGVREIGYIPENAVIHGKSGTYAKQYAKEHGVRYFCNELTVKVGLTDNIIEGDFSGIINYWAPYFNVVNVDENGVVCGLEEGTTKVYACWLSGNLDDIVIFDNCIVHVVATIHEVNSIEDFQSSHDYENSIYEVWEYSDPEAEKLVITFSEDTEVEADADKIVIIDGTGAEVGTYTGKELAGQTITVNSNTVRVRLQSNDSVTAYGFRVVNIDVKLSKLVILQQPESVEALVGDTVKFSVHGERIDSYQWYYSLNGGESWEKSIMPGSKTDTITVPVTKKRIGQMYRCQVTGIDGYTIDSEAATIKTKFGISSQLGDTLVNVGENVVLIIEASAAEKYQWYYSLDGGASWSKSIMAGNKTNELIVPVTEKRIGQKYKCQVTGINGDVLVSDVATLIERVEIKSNPKDVTAAIGDTVTFEVETIGARTYQWYYSKNGGKTWSKSTMTGNKTSVLTVPVTANRIGQKYRCQVSGSNGRTLISEEAAIYRALETEMINQDNIN